MAGEMVDPSSLHHLMDYLREQRTSEEPFDVVQERLRKGPLRL